MKSGFVTHKGKRVYVANYAHLSPGDFEQEIKAVTAELCTQPLNSTVCVNDTTGLIATPQVIALFTKSAAQTKPHLRKAAVVGIGFTGARKTLLDLVLKGSGQTAVAFEDLEAAKDWLIKD